MKNKLKLSLTNFQSIGNGELEFETGLNFIIGQSNSGKSATFRALKACLSNPSGSQRFIKKDTNVSEVTLEYNGNVITWKRTKKESSYEINGETFVKTGNSDAFKLVEDTGFVRDHNETIMNIEEELQLPFPYGTSKTDLFKLFENIFCVSDSAIILKSAKDYENEVKSEIRLLENEKVKIKNKLAELNKFKKEINISELKGKQNSLILKNEKLMKLKDGVETIKKAVELLKLNLPEPYEVDNYLNQYQELMDLKKVMHTTESLHKVSQNLSKLESPKPIDLKEYYTLRQLYKDINVVKELSGLTLPEYEVKDKIGTYYELVNYRESLNKIYATGRKAAEKKKRVAAKLSEIQGKLREFKVCPLCHRLLEGETEC